MQWWITMIHCSLPGAIPIQKVLINTPKVSFAAGNGSDTWFFPSSQTIVLPSLKTPSKIPKSASFGNGRAWPARKIFFLIINITMFFYINNNVKGFLLRKEGKRGFPKETFMFHEAAVSKNKPGFCDRRMDREERITFMKYLIKFCSKGERNNFFEV